MSSGKEGISSYLEWVFRVVRDRRFAQLPLILSSTVKKLAPGNAGEVKRRIQVIEDNVFERTGVEFSLFAEVWARSIERPLNSGVCFTKCKRRKNRYTVRELQVIGYDLIARPYIELIGFVFEEEGIDLEALFGGSNEEQGVIEAH